MLTNLLNAGMNVMRLNFSHGDYEEHGNRIKNMRAVMAKPASTPASCWIPKARKFAP